MLLSDVTLSPGLASHIDELTTFLKTAQNLIVVLIAFVTTGGTAVIVAWQKIRSQVKQVEAKVTPIKTEVTETEAEGGTTLRKQVDDIKADVQHLQETRIEQHKTNTDRLDSIEGAVSELKDDLKELKTEQANTRDDLKEIRGLVLKVLSKAAGIS